MATHKLEISIDRDKTRATIHAECECGNWSAGKNLSGQPTTYNIGDAVGDITRSHLSHVWSIK